MQTSNLQTLDNMLQHSDWEAADQLIDALIDKDSSAQIHLKLATVCLARGFWRRGEALFSCAVHADANAASEVGILIELPAMTENPELAVSLVEKAVYALPNDRELRITLGIVYSRDNQLDKAEKIYLEALNETGNHFRPMLALSEVYYKMVRYHDALACSQLAIEQNPASEIGYYNLGLCHMALGQFQQAVQQLEKTIQINPQHSGAHINLAHIMLKLGHFSAGWKHNEWRFADQRKVRRLDSPVTPWQGQALAGKRILLWSDQGLGDQIMYSSLLPRLTTLGAIVSVFADPRLELLFQRSFTLERFHSNDEEGLSAISASTFDYQLSLGSLPAHFLHNFDCFGAGDAFLQANTDKVEAIRNDLVKKFPGKKLVGFGWRGGAAHTRGHARNIGLSNCDLLLARSDCQFINLQYDCSEEEFAYLSSKDVFTPDLDCRNDIEGLASYLKAIDLFISADNSTVHLAGALGVKVWNILPFDSEWRWFLESEKAYWYKSMSLFRQFEIGYWARCLEDIIKRIDLQ